jgi:hypothetical protein
LRVDRRIKGAVINEAKKLGIYPVEFIESLVKENFDPFDHSDVKHEGATLRKLYGTDKHKNDREFLEDTQRWDSINS